MENTELQKVYITKHSTIEGIVEAMGIIYTWGNGLGKECVMRKLGGTHYYYDDEFYLTYEEAKANALKRIDDKMESLRKQTYFLADLKNKIIANEEK